MKRIGIGAPLIVGAAVIVFLILPTSLPERVSLFAAPSADRAYAYGIRHFNSQDAASYNIADARYFFEQAARLDPQYPYVHHQMARIFFLTARYPEALAEINREIANDPSRAPSYYMRGLIEGYLNDYGAAVRDYKEYVTLVPDRWEGRTDYAWVLIKTGDYKEALAVINTGLKQSPDNPWLLSMRATILYESGAYADALSAARTAARAVDTITEAAWLQAYPGNDPSVASMGIQTLRDSARENLKKIEAAAATHGIK